MTIRIGVVGTGFGAAVQVPAFRSVPGIEVVAIASASATRAETFARALSIATCYEGFGPLVSDAEVDAVYVSSPPATHLEVVRLAAAHGKHVLCEKPVGTDAADARAMAASVADAGTIGMINFEFRQRPARRLLSRLINDEVIGRTRAVRIVTDSGFLDNPGRGWNWWSVKRHGGGLLEAAGSHLLDAVAAWLGPVRAVDADLRTDVRMRHDRASGRDLPVETDDNFALNLDFHSGASATILGSGVMHGRTATTVEVHGERGVLLLSEPFGAYARYPGEVADSEIRIWCGDQLGEVIPVPSDLAELGRDYEERLRLSALNAEAFVSVIEGRLDTYPTMIDGLRVREVLDAAHESAHRRQWITVRRRDVRGEERSPSSASVAEENR